MTPLIACLPQAACSRLLLSVCPFTIDDTGCPTSQSVSPSKTPPGSERSSHGSPVLPERKAKVKKVRVMAECSAEPRSTQRHKRELRSAMRARGEEKHTNEEKALLELMELISAAPHASKPHWRLRQLTKRSFFLLICKAFFFKKV